MIKLSRLTDYAVALLTQMVREGNPPSPQSGFGGAGGIHSASELAEDTGLSPPTVSKILKQLTKAGLVTAQRGATGGYKMARLPSEITIAEIIEAMDGPIALTECAEGGNHECRVESICPLSGGWDKINRAVKRALGEVSLAEMAGSFPAQGGEAA